MSTLLLPFAKRIADAQMVAPDEVARGAACNCLCPGCDKPVVARHGTEREWHFAHAKGEACEHGYEASVHEIAKQLIRQRRCLLLPALEVTITATDAFGQIVEERVHVQDARTVRFDECKTSQIRNDVTVDVVGRIADREILVEITVFHRLMPDKRERLQATGLPSMQIDLDEFKVQHATRAGIEFAIFEKLTNRCWLQHPRMDDARRDAQVRLDARLAQRMMDWQRQEETRKAEENKRQHALSERAYTQFTFSERSAEPVVSDWIPMKLSAIWRASFPTRENIIRAAQALSVRTGRDFHQVMKVADTITSRGQLASTAPTDLARKWAESIDVAEDEIFRFLGEAGYILR